MYAGTVPDQKKRILKFLEKVLAYERKKWYYTTCRQGKGGHLRKRTERFLKISKLVLDNHDSLRYDIRVAAEKTSNRAARTACQTGARSSRSCGISCYHHNRIYDNLKEMQPWIYSLKEARTDRSKRASQRINSERTKPSKLRSRISVNVYLWQYWTWTEGIHEMEPLQY